MQLAVNGQLIELDKEGFLKNLTDWNESVAHALATNDNIDLTDAHWEIIYLVRDFYQTFQISPSMRALVKRTEQMLGAEKGKSIYLLQLFPISPAKFVSKIAGLPKPANCL
ncbi:sulfurtransferase TusE [Cellvibrio zantedeschiae]|uniref:Sulfurtransferase n=1 Tax=Cellvibrio zantedeschiae TaxID=1237077 RepID=A0ABQ3B1E1_9GAMM|nr:TusE/DsrC/DsvC family sulfur relay protein [Cellvibrio zantedeschiae]GGY70490.1 sulfurtransferase TusE [Cellvibrio zantedeschiae]